MGSRGYIILMEEPLTRYFIWKIQLPKVTDGYGLYAILPDSVGVILFSCISWDLFY